MNAEPSPADGQDASDMAQLAAGHDVALNNLMERHAPRLFNYLLRALQNEEDAADLAQETFARVHQNRAAFDARHKFSTWLYAIASNLVRDRYRWRKRHPQVSLNAPNESTGDEMGDYIPATTAQPNETALAGERAEAVRRAVAALPEELRLPLILAEYEEKSYAEIAVALHCSVKAVDMRIYRARQQLRTALARWLD
jgi:RNA polymerase sigma-70 factor (ECF subfamily)